MKREREFSYSVVEATTPEAWYFLDEFISGVLARQAEEDRKESEYIADQLAKTEEPK